MLQAKGSSIIYSSIIYAVYRTWFIYHLLSIIYKFQIYNLQCGAAAKSTIYAVRQKVHLSSIIYNLCRRHKFIYHLLSVGYSLVIRSIYVSY